MEQQARVRGIIAALKDAYPDPFCALHYKKDYELMIAVRLSAQCTDERVNKITPALFARFPTLDAFADADVSEVEEYVRSCGFYKHKARDIVLACQALREKFGALVRSLDECYSMHDFRTVPGEHKTNVIFEVAVPFDCKKSEEEVKEEICRAVERADGGIYRPVVLVERQ